MVRPPLQVNEPPPSESGAPALGAITPLPRHSQPSGLYRADLWRFGLAAARHLPPRTCEWIAALAARIYCLTCPSRRNVVVQNLAPAVGGNPCHAEKIARKLFGQFGRKLADLWRYESGLDISGLFCELTGWDYFLSARAQNRGILLLTIHLGNWEFGAPLLAERGVKLQVITQAEPDPRLTRLRQEARARWGIDTIVLGEDQFGFVEVIRRLESGAAVALLMDRPTRPTGVAVELFGRPFQASISAAELARATGAALLPVYLPRTDRGYLPHTLPAIQYDRRTLGSREARQRLTQEIMRAFQPAIREYLDQWYHFVPLWPA